MSLIAKYLDAKTEAERKKISKEQDAAVEFVKKFLIGIVLFSIGINVARVVVFTFNPDLAEKARIYEQQEINKKNQEQTNY